MYIILLPIRRALSQTALGSEGGGVYIISLSTDSYSKGHTNICIKDNKCCGRPRDEHERDKSLSYQAKEEIKMELLMMLMLLLLLLILMVQIKYAIVIGAALMELMYHLGFSQQQRSCSQFYYLRQ